MTLLERIIEDARKVPKTLMWKLNNRKATLEDEEEVLASGNAGLAYKFARYVPGANISRLEDGVVQDPYWSYRFARCVPGANVERLREVCKGTSWAF